MAQEFRVAIGAPGQPRSGVWKFWSNKSDVYARSSTFGEDAKISVHGGRGSLDCRFALTSNALTRIKISNQEGVQRRWTMPLPDGTGAVELFGVLFPATELAPIESGKSDLRKVACWISAPRHGDAILLRCWLTPQASLAAFDAPAGTLCHFGWADGRNVFVTYTVQPVDFDLEVVRGNVLAHAAQRGVVVDQTYRGVWSTEGDPQGFIELLREPQPARDVAHAATTRAP